MVRGSQVALKHVIHDMEAKTLVMELRRRAIKRWVPCADMDRRLKIPHLAKAECGFRTTPEECLYDSGPIGPSVWGLIIQYNTIQYNTIQYNTSLIYFFGRNNKIVVLSSKKVQVMRTVIIYQESDNNPEVSTNNSSYLGGSIQKLYHK